MSDYPSGETSHAFEVPAVREVPAEYRKGLLEYLGIPHSMRDVSRPVGDKKRQDWFKRRDRDWSKAFTNTIRELLVDEEKFDPRCAEIATMLAGLFDMHSLDTPTFWRLEGKEPLVSMRSRGDEYHANDSRNITIRREADDRLRFGLGTSRLITPEAHAPQIESHRGALAWVEDLFCDADIQGDLSFPPMLGSKYVYESLTLSSMPSNKEQALLLVQAFRTSEAFIQGLKREISARTGKVANANWKRGAYTVETRDDGEVYLSDWIDEQAITAFKEFFRGEGRDVADAVKDVNVTLRAESITPTFTHRLSGEPILLPPIPLEFSIPELRIDTLDISASGKNEEEPRHITLLEDQRPNLAIRYYPMRGEKSPGAMQQIQLFDKIGIPDSPSRW